MKIGIDLDGTITDFHKAILHEGKKYGKKHFNNSKIKNYNGFDIEEIFDWNKEEVSQFKEYIRNHFRMKIKPRKDAQKFFKEINKIGISIYIITSRKENDLIDCTENTIEWLKENNIQYDKLIIGDSNKLQVSIDNNIDIFIDDKIKHCIKTHQYGIKTYIFDNPYNKSYNYNKVRNFKELLNIIKEEYN